LRVPVGDVRSPVWDPKKLQLMGKKARNNYTSMAELDSNVNGHPRESFGLCVSFTFQEKEHKQQ